MVIPNEPEVLEIEPEAEDDAFELLVDDEDPEVIAKGLGEDLDAGPCGRGRGGGGRAGRT